MTAQPLPALTSGDPSAWGQALYAFLVEKGNRSGSRRTVESYSRMLWPFFADLDKAPDRVKPADVLALSIATARYSLMVWRTSACLCAQPARLGCRLSGTMPSLGVLARRVDGD